MGIRLDWEIEAEKQNIRQKSGEDPVTKWQRRRRILLLLLIPLILLAIVGAVAGAVVLRLRELDRQIVDVLEDTVDAEIATLRIGNEQAFMDFQRSASTAWLDAQQAVFDDVQDRKVDGNLQLTGQIMNTTVDDSRARVQVQEIIDGTPYVRTWFYWRYDDGWRHVPPDYTFWGDEHTLQSDALAITYRDVDTPLAQSMHETLSGWLDYACNALACGDMPQIRVSIVPDPGLQIAWSPDDVWLMQMPSPYTDRARVDMPFEFALRFDVANLVAERLVNVASGNMQPVYPADAYYLRSSIVSWLVGRFVAIDTNTFLISSLAQNYGEPAVGSLLSAMQPDSNAAIINSVTGAESLAQANLDWRDFLTWRLALESELIARREEAYFLTLYDTRDEATRDAAYARFNAGEAPAQRVVVSAQPETGPDGAFQLRAQVESGEEAVIFRLVNDTWLRAN